MHYIARCFMMAFILSAIVACEGENGVASSSESANGSLATSPTLITGASKATEGVTTPIQWKTVQNVSYDWAGDGAEYQFTLSIPNPWDDPGNFTKLQIVRRGKVMYELTDTSGLVKYEDGIGGEMKRSVKKNLLPSPYLLMIPGAGKADTPILLVFGWAYGSSPGSLRVITLEDGTPKEALYLENFEVTAFTDLNHDLRLELVGKKCFSQGFGPDLLTYDPYSVFRSGDAQDAPMTLDLLLSEDYNKKNYYGWAGPECREDMAVVLHPPGHGKPVILPTKEAEALFEK
jgi:hypothetical protein